MAERIGPSTTRPNGIKPKIKTTEIKFLLPVPVKRFRVSVQYYLALDTSTGTCTTTDLEQIPALVQTRM